MIFFFAACIYAYHVYAWCLHWSKEGTRSSGSRVMEVGSHQVGAGKQTCVSERAISAINY